MRISNCVVLLTNSNCCLPCVVSVIVVSLCCVVVATAVVTEGWIFCSLTKLSGLTWMSPFPVNCQNELNNRPDQSVLKNILCINCLRYSHILSTSLLIWLLIPLLKIVLIFVMCLLEIFHFLQMENNLNSPQKIL